MKKLRNTEVELKKALLIKKRVFDLQIESVSLDRIFDLHIEFESRSINRSENRISISSSNIQTLNRITVKFVYSEHI